jgi:arginase family enzyme
MPRYPLGEIRGRAEAVSTEALSEIEGKAERFLVHLDGDVIDFTDCPIADVPQQGAGLQLREATSCLKLFVRSPKFSGRSSGVEPIRIVAPKVAGSSPVGHPTICR